MNRRRLLRAVGFPAVMFAAAAYLQARPQQSAETARPEQPRQASTPAADSSAADRALLAKYCNGCHNEKTKQGNLVLSTLDVANAGADAERWELVIRKLRARAMPPLGRPRPEEAAYDALIAHLETSLDKVAAANPESWPHRHLPAAEPDRVPERDPRSAQRGSRRRHAAAERRLEPRLRQHQRRRAFADAARTVLSAAQKISRLAVGTPVRSAGAETVVLPNDLTQEDHFDGLPFGTRAGAAVPYTFPADGEYQFELRLTRDRNELIEGLSEPHQMEVSIDGVRQQVFTLTPAQRTGPVDPMGPQYDPAQASDSHLNFRTRVTGGPHVIQVAFLKRPSALVETERQPYLASFNSDRTPRTQPALYSVSVAGPFNQTGIGDTPSRQRIFTCRPVASTRGSVSGNEMSCARSILSTFARRAYRRPPTNEEVQTLLGFYQQGRADGSFEQGIEMALACDAHEPGVPVPHRARSRLRGWRRYGGQAPVTAYRISDLELASRLSFFLWSSIPDDALLDVAVKGRLDEPAVLEQQVRRMLADPRARRW